MVVRLLHKIIQFQNWIENKIKSQVQNLDQQTPKKASHVKQENKTGDPKNSAKMNTVKDSNLRSEDEFIKSMGNETSDWAQVS